MDRKGSGTHVQRCAEIRVKLLPRSSRTRIVGCSDGLLKIKVTAPPVDGRANKALRGLLAKRLGVAKDNIEIVSGERSSVKLLRILGLASEEVNRLLEMESSL